MAIPPSANMTTSVPQSGRPTPIMVSRHDIECARLNMLEARKALDEYEVTYGYGRSPELQRLEREFSKATETYLRFLEEER